MKYRYRSDEEMKDSGVEWIGKIPKDLETIKLKYISSLKSGEFISKDDYDDNGIYNIYGSNGKIGKSNKINNIKKSILIGRVGACGELNIIEKGWVSDNALILDVLDKNYNFKYIFYSLKNINLKELSTGTAQPLITGTQIKNLDILDFDKYDSNKIAEFLDEKISDFDNIISKKEKLIEKLEEAKKSLISESVTGKVKVVKNGDDFEIVKREDSEMKDSGVEWIGKIPKDFDKVRLGLITFVTKLAGFEYTDYMFEALSENEEIPIVRAGNIKMNKFIDEVNEFIDIETSKKLNRSSLNKKCILMTFIGAGIGEVALFNKENRYHLAPNVAKIEILGENKLKLDEKYLVYYLMSSSGQEEVNKIKKASAQPSLSMGTIRSMKIVFPKLEAQLKINEYLDLKINEIDKLIEKIKMQIEKLKEAKQALISEAVTGKIEIL